MSKEIIDYIGDIWYDESGTMIWGGSKDDLIHLLNVRGWGRLTSGKFKGKENEAAVFQDNLGKFIVDAIKEKIERDTEK